MGRIDEFYEGQCIFLTGATGFLGKILYEKLLRDVPGIRRIYILIRKKKGLEPEDRLHKEILTSPLFNVLKAQLGIDFEEVVRKTVPVAGDITQDNLGMSAETLRELEREVTVVIHCAATISFIEPIREAFDQNVLGSLRVLEVAKRFPRLQVFTHVSTAYTGSNVKGGPIDEELHPLHFDNEAMIKRLIPMTTEAAERSLAKKILGKYPNTYCVTKCMAEHALAARRGNIPMVFSRPAIIGAICRDPIPGFIDTLAAAGGLYAAIGVGLMTFLPGHPRNVGDQVPADFVANSIIVSTALNANRDKLSIYHVGTSHKNPLRWIQLKDHLFPYWLYYPPKERFGSPAFDFMPTPYVFEISYFMRWVVPTVLYKLFAYTIRDREHIKQANLLALWESRMVKIIGVFRHFIENSWIFTVDKNDELISLMNDHERELFNFDATKLQWYPDYLLNYCYGLRVYVLKEKGLRRPWADDNVDLRLKRTLLGDVRFAAGKPLALSTKGITRTPAQLRAMVLGSARVQQAIRLEAGGGVGGGAGSTVQHAEQRASEIMDVLCADASPSVLRGMAWFFRKVFRKLYSSIMVNETGMDRLKTLVAQGAPLVLCPTHRSHMDFLVLSYLCFAFNVPVPHIASEEDFLDVVLVRWVFRRSGAFYMRRGGGSSSRGDALYQAIFGEYVRRLLCDGYPVEFFIEGSRSRTGKMRHPSSTVLSAVVDAYMDGRGLDDVHMVPISVSYEKVFESGSFVAELLGEQKREKPSLAQLARAAKWAATVDFGRINVQIADPIALQTFVAAHPHPAVDEQPSSLPPPPPPPPPQAPRAHITHRLSWHITEHLRDNGVCMSPHLVAMMVLFGRNGVRRADVVDWYDQFRAEVEARGGWIDPLGMTPDAIVSRALRLLAPLVVCKNGKCMVRMTHLEDRKAWLHLAYYKNHVLHWFYQEGVVACALASTGKHMYDVERGVAHAEVLGRARFLSRFFRYEFPRVAVDFPATVDAMVEQGVLGRIRDGQEDRLYVSPKREQFFVHLCAMFWPFVDTYWVTALALLSAFPKREVKMKHLVDRAQAFAIRFYEERLVDHYECNNRESMENAMRVFLEQGVLETVAAAEQDAAVTAGGSTIVRLGKEFAKEAAALEKWIGEIAKFRKLPVADVRSFHALVSLL